jgi:hypothetical protein
MNVKSILFNFMLIGSLHSFSLANADEPGEGITFDPLTGNYTVSYFVELDDGQKLLQKTFFEPATKIDPSVKSKLRLDSGNAVLYLYTVSSGHRSQQQLGTVRSDLTAKILGVQELPATVTPATELQVASIMDANKRALAAPLGWNSSTHSDQPGIVRVSWNAMGGAGIQVGNSLTGFGFFSLDIPGIGTVELVGSRKRRITYAGDGPQGDVKQQFDTLRQKDFVSRNAMVPTIAVPVPFDAAALIDRIRAHVATWPAKQLLDPAYAAQLDRILVAAANAFRSNQPKAGREHIESLRKMLEHEHKYLDHDDEDNDDTPEHKAATRLTIDRLAARVLDFDLRFVLKRMEKEHEHEHDHDEIDRRK